MLPRPPAPWRALPREAAHVTLVFLGEQPDPAPVAALLRDLPGVGELRVGETLLLPPRRPRVIAVRIEDPAGRLAALQSEIARRLMVAGLHAPERRPFLAHVTIGRLRSAAAEPQAGSIAASPSRFVAETVTLYRSRLARDGARYEALHRSRLGAG